MNSFRDRTAFITGGAGGIGLSVARSLGKRGAAVMLADLDGEAAARAAATLSDEGIVAASVGCDVADASAVENAARETLQRFGKVHIVVNNAGVSLDGKTGEIPLEEGRPGPPPVYWAARSALDLILLRGTHASSSEP